MNLGIIKRAKPRLIVLSGFGSHETMTRKAAHPVKAGVSIKSGQVIVPVWNNILGRYEWDLGGLPGQEAYFADADSTDRDVISADSLVGLSCSGTYELQTGYFDATAAEGYAANTTYLTFGTGTNRGNLVPGTIGTDTIIGVVSRYRNPINLEGQNSEAEDTIVLTFRTLFIPPQSEP